MGLSWILNCCWALSLPLGATVSCASWSASLWGPPSSSSCGGKFWGPGGAALPMDALQIQAERGPELASKWQLLSSAIALSGYFTLLVLLQQYSCVICLIKTQELCAFSLCTLCSRYFLRWKFQTRIVNGKEGCNWDLRGVCVCEYFGCVPGSGHMDFYFLSFLYPTFSIELFSDSSCSKNIFTVHYLCLLLWDRIITDWTDSK